MPLSLFDSGGLSEMGGSLPATTFNGDLTIGANKIKTTNLLLKEGTADILYLKNAADSTFKDLYVGRLIAATGISFDNAKYITAPNTDNNYTFISARDNGVGVVEIARLQGAADPYFQIGRDDTGVATNSVTDMLVLQAGAGTNNEAAGFGLGISFKLGNAASEVEERASIDAVLAGATDGSEWARIQFGVMTSGVMTYNFSLLSSAFVVAANVSLPAVVDQVQIGAYDIGAGRRTLALATEEAIAAETITPDKTLTVRINGANYKIPLLAV